MTEEIEEDGEDVKYRSVFNNHRVKEGTISPENPRLYLKPATYYQKIINSLVKKVPAYQWVLGNRECK